MNLQINILQMNHAAGQIDVELKIMSFQSFTLKVINCN